MYRISLYRSTVIVCETSIAPLRKKYAIYRSFGSGNVGGNDLIWALFSIQLRKYQFVIETGRIEFPQEFSLEYATDFYRRPATPSVTDQVQLIPRPSTMTGLTLVTFASAAQAWKCRHCTYRNTLHWGMVGKNSH